MVYKIVSYENGDIFASSKIEDEKKLSRMLNVFESPKKHFSSFKKKKAVKKKNSSSKGRWIFVRK